MRRIITLFFFVSLLCHAEPLTLQPRRRNTKPPPEPTPIESQVTDSDPEDSEETEEGDGVDKNISEQSNRPLAPKRTRSQHTDRETPWDISIFAGTPLGQNNTFDQPFSTFAAGGLFSVPLTQLQPKLTLFGTIGAAITFSALTLTQPAVSFTHWYFHFPLLLTIRYSAFQDITLEGFAGLALRPWENDSRPTVDGGFRGTTSVSILQPEFGVAGLYSLSDSIYAKLSASYLWLTLGIGFLL